MQQVLLVAEGLGTPPPPPLTLPLAYLSSSMGLSYSQSAPNWYSSRELAVGGRTRPLRKVKSSVALSLSVPRRPLVWVRNFSGSRTVKLRKEPWTETKGCAVEPRRETRSECPHRNANFILPGHKVIREEAADDTRLN